MARRRNLSGTFQLQDGTQYRSDAAGTWRRDPPKVGGRERKKARKRARRIKGATFGNDK